MSAKADVQHALEEARDHAEKLADVPRDLHNRVTHAIAHALHEVNGLVHIHGEQPAIVEAAAEPEPVEVPVAVAEPVAVDEPSAAPEPAEDPEPVAEEEK